MATKQLKRHDCDYCPESFDSGQELVDHLNDEHQVMLKAMQGEVSFDE